MVGAGVCAVLAVLFGVLDLEISKAFVNPDDPVARTLEVLGECTTPVLGMLSLAMLFLTPPSASRAGQVWLRVGAFLGAAGLAAYLFLTLPGYFGASFFAPAALLWRGWYSSYAAGFPGNGGKNTSTWQRCAR